MARELKPCGTHAAYMRHKRKGEPVDEACALAARDQKNSRSNRKREESAGVVQLAVAAEPPVEDVDELLEARENLRVVKAAMSEGAPHNTIAALSKRRQELVAFIRQLESQGKPGGSVLDQLAQRRKDRLSKTAD